MVYLQIAGCCYLPPENSYYARNTQPYSNQPAYLAANPDVEALINSGEYQSAWGPTLSKLGLTKKDRHFLTV